MARNKHPEETVQKILDAALEVFLEKGFEQTTVLDIVDHMGGLTRGAFYHHFKTKEEVLDALGDQVFFKNNPFEKAKQQKELSGLEKLKYALKLSATDDESRKISVMALTALDSPAFLKKLIDDNQYILAPIYQEIIEEGMADGSIPAGPAKPLADMVTFLTNFWMIPTIFSVTVEESIERFLFVKVLLEKMEIPLLDDEIVAIAMKQAFQEE